MGSRLPEPTDAIDRSLSFCTPSIARRTHHLHVVEVASEGWHGWLAFRDYLRAHPDVVAEYATLKTDLAARHGANPNERDAYRAGKTDFIVSVHQTCSKWADSARSCAPVGLIPADTKP